MQVVISEWLEKPDEEGDGLLKVELQGEYGIPLPVETHHVLEGEATPGKVQDFQMILEDTGELSVYQDEEDFLQRQSGNMAPESLIPSGLFSPDNDPDFTVNSTAIVTGRVVKTYEDPTEFGFPEEAMLFSMECLGTEFDAVTYSEEEEVRKIRVGNIVSGMYWVQGWPAES